MNSQTLGLRVASIIFGLISLAQLLRLVIQPEVLVAGHQMPLWPSVLAFMIFGGLSICLWTLSRTERARPMPGKHGDCLNITTVVLWFLGAPVRVPPSGVLSHRAAESQRG
jgi:hypothetical protein